MSYATLNRIGGFIVVLAGSASILFNAVLWTGVIPRSLEYPGYLTLQTLFLFTLIAVLTRHAERPSVLMLIGFVLAAIDIIFGIGFSYYASFAFPILRDQFPDAVRAVLAGPVGAIGMYALMAGILGNLLFYAGAFRARLVPRWAAAVVIVSQVLSLAMPPYNLSVVIACVGLIGIGYSMIVRKAEKAPALQPQAAV